MADALQMFLMAGSSLQLGGSSVATAYDSEAPLFEETLPFAAQLAEVGEQPIALTERQKAAATSSQRDSLQTEPVNPESLQAILEDDQSSTDEKDAARAWLSIIRAGQQEKASMTLTALSPKQKHATEEESEDTKSQQIKQLRTARQQAGTKAQSDAKVPELNKAGSQPSEQTVASSEPKVRSELVKDTTLAASTQLKESVASFLTSKEESSQHLVDVANDDSAAMQATKRQESSHASLEQRIGKTTKANAITTALDPDTKAMSKESRLVNAVNSSAETLIMTGSEEHQETAATSDAMSDARADLVGKAASASEKVMAGITVKSMVSEDSLQFTERKVPTTDGDISTLLDSSQVKVDSIRQALQQDAVELKTAPAQVRGALPERSNQAQTLTAAVQARAESQNNLTQASTQSGEQKSGEQKEQSMAGAMLSAMQQVQAEKGKETSGRFDASQQQEHIVSEESLQRAASSNQSAGNLGLVGQTTVPQPVAMALGTAQIIQSQGSSPVQAVSSSTSVSELLKQPLNLLVADASIELRERLVMMVRNSVHSAEIKLEPAELGSMHIRVSMQQEQASVQFLVQQAHAKEVLEQQLPKLRDMLGEQGIELADGQVSQQQSGQQQQQQTTGGNTMTEDDETLMQEQRLPVAKPSNRLVDYYA